MIIAAVFIISLLAGVPIAIVLGATGVVHAFVLGEASLYTTLPKQGKL